MFERFTERARLATVWAQDEARAAKHHNVGTEHLLLGLTQGEDGDIAKQALATFGLHGDRVRFQMLRIIGEGTEESPPQIPFTPRAKKVLELALREALSFGHNYIGTAHLLLGLLRETEGVATRILTECAPLDVFRNEVVRRIGGQHHLRSPAIREERSLRRVSTETTIRTVVLEGVGESGSPFREVTYWHQMDGTLIGYSDPSEATA